MDDEATATAPTELETDQAGDDEPTPILLDEPVDGIPDVVNTEAGLLEAARAIRSGAGPVAFDAERASGYRYGQHAYLVQLRREGSGSWLIDPVACPDLTPINEAIGAAEWVLHAATQDLACLRELGLQPRQLFDTELAGRLLGLPRVGLASVTEHYLGLTLAKEHSAVDWSTRPLPEPWLRYAALDVEVLVELRNLMGADLWAQDKAEWASQEFEALLTWEPHIRVDPWRHTSGVNRIRGRRGMAVLREVWQTREQLAMNHDVSPGRLVPDRAIVDIVVAAPTEASALPRSNRAIKRFADDWVTAVRRGLDLPQSELPPRSVRHDGPPATRSWAERDPVAAHRLQVVREFVEAFSEEHHIPVENICTPSSLRQVIWAPPHSPEADRFRAELAGLGVRPWQIDIVVPILVDVFSRPVPEPGAVAGPVAD